MFKSKLSILIAEESRRRGKKLQLKDVAEATGISPVALTRWTSGRGMSRLDGVTTFQLLKFFNVGLSDLVDVEGDDDGDPENKTRPTPNAA